MVRKKSKRLKWGQITLAETDPAGKHEHIRCFLPEALN